MGRAIHRVARAIGVNRLYLFAFLVSFSGCETISQHQFVEPQRDWQTRIGQLLYRTPKTRVIGDVVMRFSKSGDFELTFSKGAGVNLLVIRQDRSFAEVKGPLAGRGWSGPLDRAPQQLRAWRSCATEFFAFRIDIAFAIFPDRKLLFSDFRGDSRAPISQIQLCD